MKAENDTQIIPEQCGWLGLCLMACPLWDPARRIPPTGSTAPGLDDAREDERYEIVISEDAAGKPGTGGEQ